MGGGDFLTGTQAVGAPIWCGKTVGGSGLDELLSSCPRLAVAPGSGRREERDVI